MNPERAHLVLLKPDGLLLVKRPDIGWQQLQDEYVGYMTSLGPWTAKEIMEYFILDYGEDDARWPLTRRSIADFMRATDVLVLKAD